MRIGFSSPERVMIADSRGSTAQSVSSPVQGPELLFYLVACVTARKLRPEQSATHCAGG